jgi:uncharacterized protein YjbI with pentapeptide repeats
MADPEENKRPDEREATKDEGCPVPMYGGKRCGRAIYNAPRGVDKTPACLMHSHDPNKNDAAFQAEFERIVVEANEGIADFSEFVFPGSYYPYREFKAKCWFARTTFMNVADFSETVFRQDTFFTQAVFKEAADFSKVMFAGRADFSYATLTQEADFREATFELHAKFSEATFGHDADFRQTEFTGGCDFSDAIFTEGVDFSLATLTMSADFRAANFKGDADFSDTRFVGCAEFGRAKFAGLADFSGAEFSGTADFHNSSFTEVANFSVAKFAEQAKFMEATFKKDASFWLAEFNAVADFHHATFEGAVEFREVRIPAENRTCATPVFVLVRCEMPERVAFYKTYLGRALFHNCDVSRFLFSNVLWRERPGSRKSMVFEEAVNVDEPAAAALRPQEGNPDERNYALIAELYQQLKKNYDDRRDYWTAGDFHYGEMEMKRRASPRRNPVLRWLHRNVGLVAWYQRWSDYGENYVKPFLRLVLVLALFSLIYPACGLRRAVREATQASTISALAGVSKSSADELRYSNFFQFIKSYPRQWEGTMYFFGHSMMAGVGAAALRREFAAYEPASQCGRVAALVEFLLTSTLIALFLLAVRRQFRR